MCPRTSISIGDPFGRLTVIAKTDERQNGKIVWLCRCECGNEIKVRTSYLTSGDTRSCGCLKRDQSRVNLRDKYKEKYKDGVNTALIKSKKRTDNTSGVKGVSYDKINKNWRAYITVSGRRISLGAYKDKARAIKARKEAEEKYFKPYLSGKWIKHPEDLTDHEFGRLTVEGLVKRDKNGQIWRCRCECGKSTEVRRSSLTSGATRSCGCYRRERMRNLAPKQQKLAALERHKKSPNAALKRKIRSDNKSGVIGVRFNKQIRKWVANITVKGKQIYLGSYESIDDATQARRDAEEKYHKPLLLEEEKK